MMNKTKEIEIEGEKFVIKKWTLEQKLELQNLSANNQKPNTIPIEVFVKTLKYGLEKAPFELTDENIKNIDATLGEILFLEITRFNTLPKALRTEYEKRIAEEL